MIPKTLTGTVTMDNQEGDILQSPATYHPAEGKSACAELPVGSDATFCAQHCFQTCPTLNACYSTPCLKLNLSNYIYHIFARICPTGSMLTAFQCTMAVKLNLIVKNPYLSVRVCTLCCLSCWTVIRSPRAVSCACLWDSAMSWTF